MLGHSAIGQYALGRMTDGGRYAVVSQTIAVPSQEATAEIEATRASASQTVPAPTTEATVVAIISAQADQTVPAPTSSGSSDVDLTASSNITIPVPTQVIAVFILSGNPTKAQRERFTYTTRRAA